MELLNPLLAAAVIAGSCLLIRWLAARRHRISFWLKWNLLFFMLASLVGSAISICLDHVELAPGCKSLLNDARLVDSGMVLGLVISLLLSSEVARLKEMH